jgi:hypothetical protein
MLFINGAADPKDPPANVAGAARVYPNSVAITVPDQAHDYNVDPSCRAELFAAFIDRADTTGLPFECLRFQAVPPFDVS